MAPQSLQGKSDAPSLRSAIPVARSELGHLAHYEVGAQRPECVWTAEMRATAIWRLVAGSQQPRQWSEVEPVLIQSCDDLSCRRRLSHVCATSEGWNSGPRSSAP